LCRLLPVSKTGRNLLAHAVLPQNDNGLLSIGAALPRAAVVFLDPHPLVFLVIEDPGCMASGRIVGILPKDISKATDDDCAKNAESGENDFLRIY